MLAGGVAHDFNNLLTAILSYSELLWTSSSPTIQCTTICDRDPARGERATGLTRQLLAFSRRQRAPARSRRLDEWSPELEKMLRRLIGEDIELSVVPTEAIQKVARRPGSDRAGRDESGGERARRHADRRQARPSRPPTSSSTTICAAEHVGVKPGPLRHARRTDTGAGMDAATLARIFEPFFTTKEWAKARGSACRRCYGIVQQSGGHIWVDSEPGRGTTFKVYLPRSTTTRPERAAPGPGPSRSRQRDDPGGRGRRRGAHSGRAPSSAAAATTCSDGRAAARRSCISEQHPRPIRPAADRRGHAAA